MGSAHPEVQSRYVEANGQTLHYTQWSESGPPLIFLHGVTSSSTSWDLIAPHFTAQYRVMIFDLRGHGRSSKPRRGYTWVDHYGADLVDVINHHLGEQVIVVGHSLGAVVSVPIAVGAPDKVCASSWKTRQPLRLRNAPTTPVTGSRPSWRSSVCPRSCGLPE